MKKCTKCGVEKPLDKFYKHPGMSDGRRPDCSDCCKAWKKANRQKLLKYEREYVKANRKAVMARRMRYRKTARGRIIHYASIERYNDKYPEKKLAHTIVNHAIRDGRLVRGHCEAKGCKRKAHAHHDDYSKPLEVRWLCRKHHNELHQKPLLVTQ